MPVARFGATWGSAFSEWKDRFSLARARRVANSDGLAVRLLMRPWTAERLLMPVPVLAELRSGFLKTWPLGQRMADLLGRAAAQSHFVPDPNRKAKLVMAQFQKFSGGV